MIRHTAIRSFAGVQRCIVLSTLTVLAACGDPRADATRAITVAQFGDFFLYAPLYVAIDAGFMEQAGLRVNLTSTGGDETTWAAVLSGSATFGVADPTFIAIAGERGRPGVLIASLVESVPFWGVALDSSDANANERSLEQVLDGQRIATFPAPSTAYTLQRALAEQVGARITIREGAPGSLIPLLHAGAADIALELEPTVSLAVAAGGRIVYSLAEHYPDFVITGVTVTPRTMRDDPELVASFVCAIQRSLDFLRGHPDSSLVLLTRRFPIPLPVARDALMRVIDANVVPTTAFVRPSAWQAAAALRIAAGELRDTATYDKYVDNTAADRAAKECRTQ